MGKDMIKLDTWRESFQDKKGNEFVKINGKKVLVEDLKRYIEVNNLEFDNNCWSIAIKEYFKEKR